ncbi:MurR/RpiR family transcriptional regulator [Nesterenkonia sp. K-15-9-6]|uniref:MurR/RpiR family transcriptional regulator n=1 Tax=Nesterenkonia sp. K-15-9-6 TaxID=3093918 RepID=UPI004044D04C
MMAGEDLFVQLRRSVPGLSKTERRIAEVVIAEPQIVIGSTITQLGRHCGTSAATVARFCRSVGFGGYPEFRLAVASSVSRDEAARDLFRVDDIEIRDDDSAADVVTKVAYQEARAVEETARHLDTVVLDRVVDVLRGAPRIIVCGVGASGLAARDLQMKLQRLGRPVWSFEDVHLGLAFAVQCEPGDVVIGFSHAGQTHETVEMIRAAGERGATTVAVTNAPASSVAEAAEHVLATTVRESAFRAGAMSSRSAQLAVVDFLVVRLLQGDYDAGRERLERTFEVVRGHRDPAPRGRPIRS